MYVVTLFFLIQKLLLFLLSNIMRLSSLISAASALASWLLFCAAEGASDVLDLDASIFESTVNPEQMILVEFFAPW